MLNKNDNVIITSECQTKGYTGRVNKVFYCGDNLCASVRLDKLPPSEMKFQSYNVCNLELVDKKFTKSDLEPCMVVEIRNGNLLIVSKSKRGLCFVDNSGCYMLFDSYNEKLLRINEDEEWDIMKVYDFSESHYKSNEISTKGRELLFERQESQKPSARDIKIKELQDKMDELKREMEELK